MPCLRGSRISLRACGRGKFPHPLLEMGQGGWKGGNSHLAKSMGMSLTLVDKWLPSERYPLQKETRYSVSQILVT